MKSFRRTASDIFVVMFAVSTMLVLWGCLFLFNHKRFGIDVLFAVIAICILFLCGGQLIRKLSDRISDKQLDKFYVGMAAATLLLQLLLVLSLKITPVNDAEYVDTAARSFAVDGDYGNIKRGLTGKTNYFSRYPNNWAILIFMSFVYRAVYLLTGRLFYIIPRLLAVGCVQLSLLFGYMAAKKLLGCKKTVAGMTMFMILSPPLYIYSNIFYTDSFVMPFVTGSICAFVCALKTDKTRRKVLLLLLTALLLGLGFIIKGSAAIVAIAIIIYSLMVQKPKWTALVAAFSTAMIIGLNNAVTSAGLALGISDEQKLYEYKIPTISWINMSLIGDGAFNNEEFKITAKVKGYDNKKQIIKERLKYHLGNYKEDPRSFVDHIMLKVTKTWGEPTYTAKVYLKKNVNRDLYIQLVRSEAAKFVMKAIQGSLFIFVLCSCLKGFADGGSGGMFFFRMTGAGLVCFLLIWEAKPRYIVQFLPIYYLMASDGLNFVLTKINDSKFAKKIVSKLKS